MALSKQLREVADRMDQIDDHVRQYGIGNIPPNPKGLSRFNYAVLIRHDDGSTMFFENAYAVLENDVLIVFTEHNDNHVYHVDDLADDFGYCMYEKFNIPEYQEKEFIIGTKVLTKINQKQKYQDWSNPGIRKNNVLGTIHNISDSHGLCYQVCYENGQLGWFDPHEIEKVNS